MNKQKLHNKRYAHEKAYISGDIDGCNAIITELEAENYYTVVALLKECEWQAAYEWIEENM